jgi:threonyl-tRNA synthetase
MLSPWLFKIRSCHNRKIPYMLVVGQGEAGEGTVPSISGMAASPPMKTGEFADYAAHKANARDLEL